jgi:outer membrane protein assembly factor BamB
MSRTDRLRRRRRGRRLAFLGLVSAVTVVSGAVAVFVRDLSGGGGPREARGLAEGTPLVTEASPRAADVEPSPSFQPEPINTAVQGLTTFRGNATRTYYGRGPVPEDPEILWRFPASGGMCSRSSDEEGERNWCGTGWTGQPNVVQAEGRTEVRFGAYDRAVHVLDARTGEEVYEPFVTGDLVKGTVTSDPDGYPLLYVGSRDNELRILALDRGRRMVELWSLSADTAPNPVWNNDWDGSPLIVGDYLLEGGENSWFYVVKLNRGYEEDGTVVVRPQIRLMVPGFDQRLFDDLGDTEVSIESSVAYDEERGVAYFANSGGLVQGWDVSSVLRDGRKARRAFRFWTGEDTDATVVIDEEGFLYVASELERFNERSDRVGQVLKLDPEEPQDPVVWSIPVPGEGGDGGVWATPGLYGEAVFVTTNTGRLLAIDRDRGDVAWELRLPPPTWTSPVIVDDVLIVGDCAGVLHAFDLRRDPLAGPPTERWAIELGGCIESTPAVWQGTVYVGSRGGAVFALGDRG